MAYRISATTEKDKELLDALRTAAWRSRIDVSQLIRESFLRTLYGAQKHWPEGFAVAPRGDFR
jgi:hypothetical protein